MKEEPRGVGERLFFYFFIFIFYFLLWEKVTRVEGEYGRMGNVRDWSV